MAKKQAVPVLGAEFGGGFFGGEITVDGVRYALVVAPKADGEKMDLQYKKKNRDTSDGTDLDNDGLANTDRINDDNHPTAQFCRGLQIGGFDDWYLPSRDELMLIWMALGPNRKTTPESFKAGSAEAFETTWYWSSTEHAQYSDAAWIVGVDGGGQSYGFKHSLYGVRAVRRLKI